MARRLTVTLMKPMQPAPHNAMPALPATTRTSSRRPGACALPNITAERALHSEARVSSSTSAESGTPSRTRSGASSISSSDGTHRRPSISSYFGFTSQTRRSPAPRTTSAVMRAPKLSGRALAPTTAIEVASSIAATAAASFMSDQPWAIDRIRRSQAGSHRIAARDPRGDAVGGAAQRALAGALVVQRGASGLPAGNAAHPAAGVGRRTGVVEARDRCPVVGVARRGPHVEQLLERQLAVEYVAADEAVLLLHLVRPDDIAMRDRGRDVRRDGGVRLDHAIGVGLELLGVRLLVPVGRNPLREQRHDVRAVGAQRAVEAGRN